MKSDLKLFDVVALLVAFPAEKLPAGQVGTLVEELADGVFEVEFADPQGRTIALSAVEENKLLKLVHELAT